MRIKAWLGLLLLSLWPVLAYAQDQHEALVQELYVKSGLEKQVQLLPLSIQSGLDQPPITEDRLPKPPRQVLSVMKDLAQAAFAPESLKAVVLSEFRAKLTTQDLKTLLKWFDSPLGIKCTQLEEKASTPEAYAEMQKYAVNLKNSPPTLERLKVIKKFDTTVHATKSTVETVIGTRIALALAVNATLPRERQRSLADISREIKKNRPDVEAAMQLETLVSLLYSYQSLTEAEIQQYIKFAATSAGSKYHAVGNAALEKAIFEGGLRWGKAIGEAVQQINSQAEA
jgi:hypothetical protein